MKLVGKGSVVLKLVGSGSVLSRLVGAYTLATLSPSQVPPPQYNLIDGGAPDTAYTPINGFDLIDGGGA